MLVVKLRDYQKDQRAWQADVIDMASKCEAGILVVKNPDGEIEMVNLKGSRLEMAGMLQFGLAHLTETND